MTTSPYEQAPEALRLADDLEASSLFPGNRRSCNNAGAAELRRMHAENEALHAENEALRAGYNAARLEIESLQRRVKEVGASHRQAPTRATSAAVVGPSDLVMRERAMQVQQPSLSAAKPECVHEWDGLMRTSLPPKYACKHCHNFFRCPPSPGVQWQCGPQASGFTAQAAPALVENGHLTQAGHDLLMGATLAGATLVSKGRLVGDMAQAADNLLDDAARHYFDAGWKACAKFCDRDDVRFDGIVGHRGCPQFEEAFRAARKQEAKHDN